MGLERDRIFGRFENGFLLGDMLTLDVVQDLMSVLIVQCSFKVVVTIESRGEFIAKILREMGFSDGKFNDGFVNFNFDLKLKL